MDPINQQTGSLPPPDNHSIELLVLQGTPFCNIDCSYCYLPDRENTRRMSLETLKKIAERLHESDLLGQRLTVVWHAGEPLTLPIEYYEEAIALLAEAKGPNTVIDHSFQTNGTLINERWVHFFKQYDVRIGVSLDGPAWLHDRYRKTRRGTGSFEKCMRGVRLLQESGLGFHVITVVTADTLDHADELFDFYVSNGIRQVGFNIEEIEAANASSSLEREGAEAAFGQFLRRFIERQKSQPPGTLTIREFTTAFAAIARPNDMPGRNQQTVPFRILSIDVEGNISTFSPELLGARSETYGNFLFGNVHERSFREILSHPAFRKTMGEIERGVRACRESCDYFEFCGAGAPGNKFFEKGRFDVTETLFCRLTQKAVIDAVLDDMEQELELVG
ncbi:MAG: GRRM system radical SAM/SPASM domain protein [Nitrospinae bacterium]|nr:GRRM system radical SAM/SPASM domain protein [Nitrospinota bacterium]